MDQLILNFQKNIMNKIFLFQVIIFSFYVDRKLAKVGKWLNIFGASGSGKTHLAKILEKINKIQLIEAKEVNNEFVQNLNDYNCLIIDNFNNNIMKNYCIQFLINLNN